MEDMLEGLGYSAASAESGKEALDKYKTWQPDVVLMDVRMPGMDGLQATHVIKSRWPEVRVILVTVYPTAAEGPFAHEADALLLKGFSTAELREAVFGTGGRPSSTVMSGGPT